MRVLVTTQRRDPLGGHLEKAGAQVVHVALIQTVARPDPPPEGPWAVALVSSQAAPRHAPQLAAVLSGCPVVAVGHKTALALEAVGVAPAAVGTAGGAEAVARLTAVAPHGPILHVGAQALSPQLLTALEATGRPLRRWVVYQRHTPADAGVALAAARPVDVATFASGSAARAFARFWRGPLPRVVVLGPSTAEDAQAAGLPVHAVAQHRSLEALAAAALS